MGVRNDAAATYSAQQQQRETSEMTTATTTSAPSLTANDNAHLSLAELQQMAAYQQQQIQAQQSLLMAKVGRRVEERKLRFRG